MSVAALWSLLHLLSVVVVGGAYLISGIAKLRDPSGTANTFTVLRVPAVVNRAWVHRAYPIAELAIGAAVLLAPAGIWFPATLTALALTAVLLWLTAAHVRSGERASCNCFGVEQPITARTVLRNLILFAFAVVAVVAPLSAASPIWAGTHPEATVMVIVAVAATCVLTALSVAPASEGMDDGVRPELFLPEASFVAADGSQVPLSALAPDAPVLLVHVKEGCTPCDEVIGFFAGRSRIAERVEVVVIEHLDMRPEGERPGRLWDRDGAIMSSLGMRTTPAALLVAADGSIPANPVFGTAAIIELVGGIEQAVSATTPPPLEDILDRTLPEQD